MRKPKPLTRLLHAPPRPRLVNNVSSPVGASVRPLPGIPGRGASDLPVSGRPPADGPVGGRLQAFIGPWAQVTSDKWVLETIGCGYTLEFTRSPPVGHTNETDANPVRSSQVPCSRGRDQLPSSQTSGAHCPQSGDKDGVHVNLLFSSQKGGWRVASDIKLKPLNRFIRLKKFRMETLRTILGLIVTPAWGASLDLKDAYLHVPIKPGHRKFLRFHYDGILYEFVVLPFGLSTSPRVFTRIAVGAEARSHDFPLPRRLASRRAVSRGDGRGAPTDMVPCVRSGISRQRREVASDPHAISDFSGGSSRPRVRSGPPLGGTGAESASVRGALSFSNRGSIAGLAQITGPYGQHDRSNRFLSIKDEAHSAAPAVLLPTALAFNPPSSACDTLADPPLAVVDHVVQPHAWSGVPPSARGDNHSDRCLTVRVGSHSSPTTDSGRMGSRGSCIPHQHSGDASGRQCPTAFPVVGHRSGRPGALRQCHSRGIYQPSGRHSVDPAVCTYVGPHPLVHPARDRPVGGIHPRGGEHRGGCSLQRVDHSDGVVLTPSGGSVDFSANRSATRGLVRLSHEQSAADLLHKGSRSQCMAGEFPGDAVGRPSGVCVPAVLPHSSGVGQDRAGPVQDLLDRPVLAEATVVSSAGQPFGSPSGDPSETAGSPVSAQFRDESPGSGGPTPDVLGIVRDSLCSAGLSRRAAMIAAESRRVSTRTIYNSRLHHFFKWCRRRSLDPPNTTIGEIGDFLLYLFDSGLMTATIKNYRSAIAAIHQRFSDGSTVSTNSAVSQLLKGMFVNRPPVRKLVPSWDLFSVLSTLAKPPFEPLGSATLLQLSIKVVFLLAVATARRRSELHALSVAAGHIRWEPGGVRLVPSTGFLAKNQSDSYEPPDIFVPDISSFSSVSDDKFWCPVRALKWYVNRTKSIRTFRPASRDTIARWVVTAIRSVPGGWPEADGPIKAHEVRGVSSSWAYFRGVPLSEITQAASWKNANTFSDCYLKDVLQRDGRAGREVLQVATQRAAHRGNSKHLVQN